MSDPTYVQDAYARNAMPSLGTAPTAGNIVLCICGGSGNVPDPGTNGWTFGGASVISGVGGQGGWYYRYVQSGDGTTYGDPLGGTFGPYQSIMVCEIGDVASTWTDALVVANIDAYGSTPNPGTTPQTTTTANQLGVVADVEYEIFGPSPVWSSGWTQEGSGSGFGTLGSLASQAFPTSGSTVQASITGGGGNNTYLFTFIFESSSGPPPSNPVTMNFGPLALLANCIDVTGEPAAVTFYTF